MTQPLARTWRSVVSSALVALMTLVSFGPALHEGTGHDTDCEPLFVLHDAAQHRIAAEPTRDTAPSDAHCVACHLFRNSRGSQTSETLSAHAIESTLLAGHAARWFVGDGAALPLLARAPPARS